LLAVSPFAATLSAPTTMAEMRSELPFKRRRAAAIESVTRVAGILSWTSSNAVSLDPWLYGRVSVQKACLSEPAACRDLITPKAVP